MLFRSALCITVLVLLAGIAAPARAELPRNLIQQGERFLAMGKYPAATARYSKVIACCPGTIEAAEAHNDLGVIHARQGKMDLAIKEYEAALQEPAFPLAHFNLGKALSERFKENRDHELREQALFHLQAFRAYLFAAAKLPPIVTYQRAEIEEFLASSIKSLADSR